LLNIVLTTLLIQISEGTSTAGPTTTSIEDNANGLSAALGDRISGFAVDIPGAKKWYNKGAPTALYVPLFLRIWALLIISYSKLFGHWYSVAHKPRLQAHQLAYVWAHQSPSTIQV
jgi:hypothetical protein